MDCEVIRYSPTYACRVELNNRRRGVLRREAKRCSIIRCGIHSSHNLAPGQIQQSRRYFSQNGVSTTSLACESR